MYQVCNRTILAAAVSIANISESVLYLTTDVGYLIHVFILHILLLKMWQTTFVSIVILKLI